jgi:hypothetical protein
MPLTTIDIAAIRKADDLCVHLNKQHPNGLVRLIARKRPTKHNPFATDIEHVLEVPVSTYGVRGRDDIAAGIASCFAMVGLYPCQKHHAASVMATLRVGDDVEFVFCPDHHSNGYIAAANMHGDTLQLRVKRKGHLVAQWDLTTSVCARNTARMCCNFPPSDSYEWLARDRKANS